MKYPGRRRTTFSFVPLVGWASVMGCELIVGVCSNVTELRHEVVVELMVGAICASSDFRNNM